MSVPELPPHDEYLERGVLGALLTQPDRPHSEAILDDLTPFLDARDFSREQYRTVYIAALSCHRRIGSALYGDVLKRMRESRRLDRAHVSADLAGLCADASPPLIVRQEALLLAELGLQRLVMEARLRLPETASAADVELFSRRVQDKRARIEQARSGGRSVTETNLLPL